MCVYSDFVFSVLRVHLEILRAYSCFCICGPLLVGPKEPYVVP